LAELAVSGRLVVLGDTDRSTLRKVLQAIEHPSLEQALATDDDLLILAAWDPDLFDGADGEMLDTVDRVKLAETRVAWLGSARVALKQRNPALMIELLVDPPAGAIERLSPGERRRMLKEIESRKALATLQEAVTNDDDAAVISALNAVERIGARITERTIWQRIQQVVERVELVDEVIAAAAQEPMDRAKLAHLLPAVRALGLERDPRFGEPDWFEQLESQVVRYAHLRRIQAAISRDNDIAILTAIEPDPHQAVELLRPEERQRVEIARSNRRRLTIT
jgi:DNA-binding TFAR19-related protein (PDSD5 family)